jgi:mRNA interferase MazF
MRTSSNYRLGSLWLIRFDPSVGTEIRKTRPAVIISGTLFNRRSKVTVLPLTSVQPQDPRLLAVVVPVLPTRSNGLDSESFVICVEPMTFDKRRFVQHLGELELDQIQRIKSILATFLDL